MSEMQRHITEAIEKLSRFYPNDWVSIGAEIFSSKDSVEVSVPIFYAEVVDPHRRHLGSTPMEAVNKALRAAKFTGVEMYIRNMTFEHNLKTFYEHERLRIQAYREKRLKARKEKLLQVQANGGAA